jgi:primosomal protein N'
VRLEYRHEDPEAAETEARKVVEKLATFHSPLSTVIGPVPSFFAKVGGYYRWQIILRGSNPKEILRGLRLDGWRVEVDPISLL